MIMDTFKKKYKEANDKVAARFGTNVAKEIFTDLYESEDEMIRKEIIKYLEQSVPHHHHDEVLKSKEWIAWLEKQGSEPNWCHHKVDLSNCSEEYRKAYYDGWNNCNQQHSQCKSESNDVVKCLINGMKFYYEDNEEATWGTEKFSMKVKDILSWLEKQGGQKPAWSEEDETIISALSQLLKDCELENNWNCVYSNDREVFFVDIVNWLKSLRPQPKQEWSEEDQNALEDVREAVVHYWGGETQDILLYWLKSIKHKIKGE